MQKIIERIYEKALSEKEKIRSLFMDDVSTDYYIYAWVQNGEIHSLGYGKGDDYLAQAPSSDTDKYTVDFPNTHLTEKEAYVLYMYEKIKMEKLGYKKISDIGIVAD